MPDRTEYIVTFHVPGHQPMTMEGSVPTTTHEVGELIAECGWVFQPGTTCRIMALRFEDGVAVEVSDETDQRMREVCDYWEAQDMLPDVPWLAYQMDYCPADPWGDQTDHQADMHKVEELERTFG